MWEAVELREIRVFLTLAEELHFGRTALRLGLTQSRVSQSLRELESKLGAELVHRTSRRVALTAAGESFLAEAAPAYRALGSALRNVAEARSGRSGRLRFGLPNAIPHPRRMVELISRFERDHPACGVDVKQVQLSDRVQPLIDGEVDLMAIPFPPDRTDLERGPRLSLESRVLAVAADHPLSARESVTTDDIADYEVVDLTGLVPPELASRLIPERAASGRPMKRRRLQHHDWSELVTSIGRGRIVHPAFEGQFVEPGIRCVPIADMPPWEIVLVRRREDSSRLVSHFAEAAESMDPI